MESVSVNWRNGYDWQCPRCQDEARFDLERPPQERRGFEARSLATTVPFPDGCCRTIVWRRRHGGLRTPQQQLAIALDAMAGPNVVFTKGISVRQDDTSRSGEPPRWIGRLLDPDDEVVVPCGRLHAGKRGSVVISDRRFLEQLAQIARSG
jgi:hypothetical protein